MKITFVTDYDIFNSQTWQPRVIGSSGTSQYKAKALASQFSSVEHIGSLGVRYPRLTRYKTSIYKYLFDRVYHPWASLSLRKNWAEQIGKQLETRESDAIVCPDTATIAYLECNKPIVLWITSTYRGYIDFYADFSNLCQETIADLTTLDRLALDRAKLVVFPSEWAAQTAIEGYHLDERKVEIVSYGANIECDRTIKDIQKIIENRSSDKCKLLFIGVEWYRKGGDIALNVARELEKMGINVELTIVGCQPIADEPLPNYVNSVGFISKSSNAGRERFNQLISETHFLILPSRAESYGNVLCEANSFGVPCIATKVGGIPSIIKDDVNGKLFDLNNEIRKYCEYIADLFTHYSKYKKLATSSFSEYETRLNWTASGKSMQTLLTKRLVSKTD